jgi:tRNA 2-selenouridine synthase
VSVSGSINMPVLDNDQRARVGALYKMNSFEARKLGASMVSANISQQIADYFIHKPASYRPLIYCWRGGQRSQSLALVLAHTGFEVHVLEGGYSTYRRQVLAGLQELSHHFHFIVVSGKFQKTKTFTFFYNGFLFSLLALFMM